MTSSSGKRVLYRSCLALIVLLYVVSVPWYRDETDPLRLWLGMPDWVTVAILCYVAVACVNALAWLLTDVPDGFEPLREGPDSSAPTSDSKPASRAGAAR